MGSRRTYQDRAEDLARDRRRFIAQFQPDQADPQSPPVRPAIRHCWVRDGDQAVEALLIGWLRSPTGWQAEVVVIDDDAAPQLKVVTAQDIRPARDS